MAYGAEAWTLKKENAVKIVIYGNGLLKAFHNIFKIRSNQK